MSITAVVLSPTPLRLELPGLQVVNHVSTIKDHIEMNAARRAAVEKVATPHWFFLDSDDSLPADHLDVLDECTGARAAMAYTDELVLREGQEPVRRRAGAYSQEGHIGNMLAIHHLVVCDTALTHEAMKALPQGIEMFELMLYFQLAKHSAAYIPRIGYHWAKGRGFHTKPDALRSVCMAAAWCARNKD